MPPSHFWKIQFNIIISSTLVSGVFVSVSPTKMWSVPLLSPRLAAFPTHPIPFYLITWIISNRHNHTVSKGPVTGEGKVVGLSAQEPCRKDNSSTSSSIRHYWMWVVGLIPGHLPTEKEPTLRSEQKVWPIAGVHAVDSWCVWPTEDQIPVTRWFSP